MWKGNARKTREKGERGGYSNNGLTASSLFGSDNCSLDLPSRSDWLSELICSWALQKDVCVERGQGLSVGTGEKRQQTGDMDTWIETVQLMNER
jgi:hypothetical protein